MANFGDITSSVSIGAGQSVRRNAGDTAFEAYTPSSGSGVSDGDYGDVTVSGGGATWTIDNGAVTLAKQADMATGSVVYRKTAGTGVPEVQTLATLKTDLTLVKGDVGLGNVDNTSDVNKPVSTATQTALDLKVDENVAITGATKTKVTYDAKGLVTAGADATTADIADSSNKRYVTDAQLTVIGNTSGTNTGDQTSIVGITGTKAQFDTAVTDGNILYVGDVTQYTDEMAQDATGAMVANSTFVSLAYNDATPSITPSLSATGTPSASTYLRGDNTWASIAGGGDVTGPASSTDNAIPRFDGTGGKTLQGSGVTITDANGLVLPAGSATSAPITLASQTLMTTPGDGSIEMDDNCIYACTDAGNRGYIEVNHFIRADATRTFTSNTAQQAIFTTPAGGTLTLETGTYLFEGLIAMTAMSATSGSGKFSIIGAGSATLGDILWQAHGNDALAEAVAGAVGGGWHVIATQTAANVVTAATATATCFTVKGTFTVTVAGTIIPSFAQTTAAAAVVSIGSYFKCNRVGSTSVTSVGQWS